MTTKLKIDVNIQLLQLPPPGKKSKITNHKIEIKLLLTTSSEWQYSIPSTGFQVISESFLKSKTPQLRPVYLSLANAATVITLNLFKHFDW